MIDLKSYRNTPAIPKEKLQAALADALKKIDANMTDFSDCFMSAASVEHVYQKRPNTDWTSSFWPGQLWLAYELTKDEKYLNCVKGLMPSYRERQEKRVGFDTHDIGFVFTLSTVAGYKVTGDPELLDISLKAAQGLSERFREKGQFIQLAGNEHSDKALYRLIIDCLMNIELLYWAGKVTGNKDYTRQAFAHFNTTMETVVREDGSTFQNFYFDPETGARLGGGTKQGLNNQSAWSRGQAWGVAGVPFTYSYMHNDDILPKYEKLVDFAITHLPEDYVAYWDHTFTDGTEPRDSSAAAIAVCGLLEAVRVMPLSDTKRDEYLGAARKIMNSLIDNYTTKNDEKSNGLLLHATYYYAGNLGIDECNIWGDYFYMEALTRFLKPDWNQYW